jgi:hypothetical protein
MWSINMSCKISRYLLLYNTMFSAQTAATVWHSEASLSWMSPYMGQAYTQGFCLCMQNIWISEEHGSTDRKSQAPTQYIYYMTMESTRALGKGKNVMVQWLRVCRFLAKTYIQRLTNVMTFHSPSRKVLKCNLKYVCHNTFILDSKLTINLPFSGIKSLV